MRDARFSALILGKQWVFRDPDFSWVSGRCQHPSTRCSVSLRIPSWESQIVSPIFDHQIGFSTWHFGDPKSANMQLKSPCSPCRPSTWSLQRTLRSARGAQIMHYILYSPVRSCKYTPLQFHVYTPKAWSSTIPPWFSWSAIGITHQHVHA